MLLEGLKVGVDFRWEHGKSNYAAIVILNQAMDNFAVE
jgi:hypothetical protein